jgi:polysaccharide export outer membrane protein
MKFKAAVVCLLVFLILPSLLFADDYVIGDGDGLEVSVWGEKQLDANVTVRPDGKITIAGIGDVVASGFTPMALSSNLSEKLKKIVKEPIVTVTVSHITNNKIYVFGGGVVPAGNVSTGGNSSEGSDTAESISSSGVYTLPGRTTLLKFLTSLKMLKSADLTGAFIIRGGKRLDVDFYDLFMKADLSKDIALKADDMIFVPDNARNKIYVMGAVNKPTAIPYWKGMRILDVILDAQGFTKFARENSVVVLRKIQGVHPRGKETQEIVVKVNDLMKDGDISQNISLMPADLVMVKEGIF